MSWVVISETLRRHYTNLAYVLSVILLAGAGFFVSQFELPGAIWPSLVALLAIITGCAPIGPEFSSGTLQLILVKPINRAVYLLSRVAGVLIAVWIAALVAALAELAGRAFADLPQIAASLAHCMAGTLLQVSLLVLIGSFTRAYFNVAVYFLTQILLGLTTGLAARKSPEFGRALSAIMKNLFPDAPPRFDWTWLLAVTCNAFIALVLACFIFRKREVPYGAE
jgi:ABC-type transport system involved in multi-copper enzyme maturation permease subunit